MQLFTVLRNSRSPKPVARNVWHLFPQLFNKTASKNNPDLKKVTVWDHLSLVSRIRCHFTRQNSHNRCDTKPALEVTKEKITILKESLTGCEKTVKKSRAQASQLFLPQLTGIMR